MTVAEVSYATYMVRNSGGGSSIASELHQRERPRPHRDHMGTENDPKQGEMSRTKITHFTRASRCFSRSAGGQAARSQRGGHGFKPSAPPQQILTLSQVPAVSSSLAARIGIPLRPHSPAGAGCRGVGRRPAKSMSWLARVSVQEAGRVNLMESTERGQVLSYPRTGHAGAVCTGLMTD